MQSYGLGSSSSHLPSITPASSSSAPIEETSSPWGRSSIESPLPIPSPEIQEPGSLLRSDLTSVRVNSESFPPLPLSQDQIFSALPSTSSNQFVEHGSSSIPTRSSSVVPDIAAELTHRIPGTAIMVELRSAVSSLKVNLHEKESLTREIQQRMENYEADPEFSEVIKEIKGEVHKLKIAISNLKQKIKDQTIRSEEIPLDAQIDIDEIKRKELDNKKMLIATKKQLKNLEKDRKVLSGKLQTAMKKKEEKEHIRRALKQELIAIDKNCNQLKLEISGIQTLGQTLTSYRSAVEEYLRLSGQSIELETQLEAHHAEELRLKESLPRMIPLEKRRDELKSILSNEGESISESFKESLLEELKSIVIRLSKLRTENPKLEELESKGQFLEIKIRELKSRLPSVEEGIRFYQGQLIHRPMQMSEIVQYRHDMEIMASEIREKEAQLKGMELIYLRKRYPGDMVPPPVGALAAKLTESKMRIQSASDRLEEHGQLIRGFPPETQRQIISETAQQFLEIGTLPPRSSNPFSTFRNAIVQEMVNIALTLQPPKHHRGTSVKGKEAIAGIYEIHVNVETRLPNGEIVTEQKILGGFKPNDEAPGGKFGLTDPDPHNIQPGLPSEVADIRQALVSALGGPNTLDSFLVTAQHPGFNYNVRQPAGPSIPLPPSEKEGIFVEWLDAVQDINFEEFAKNGIVDSQIYFRIYEDLAFLNWDPNEGNQMIEKSTEGQLGIRYTWKQFDLDKAFPAGFISKSVPPIWARSPLANEALPLSFKKRIRDRNVEREIEQAGHFWDAEVDLKINRILRSDETPEDKENQIRVLENCRWSTAHANALRAADTLLKTAVELDATPLEIFGITRSITSTRYTMNDGQLLRDHVLIHVPNFPPNHLAELKLELHSHGDPNAVELHSELCRLFVLSKAWAITQVNSLPLSPVEREAEIIKLTQEQLGRRLADVLKVNRFSL